LFGSITAADVAEQLSGVIGSVVDKKRIDIEKPFHQTGSYEIAVKLASDIRPNITVVIEEEEVETEQKPEKKKRKAKTEEPTEVKEEKED
jgi:large subunit ribosomal protein L9